MVPLSFVRNNYCFLGHQGPFAERPDIPPGEALLPGGVGGLGFYGYGGGFPDFPDPCPEYPVILDPIGGLSFSSQ